MFVLLRLMRVAWGANPSLYFTGSGGLVDRCPAARCDVARCGASGWDLRGCGGRAAGECVRCNNAPGDPNRIVYLTNSQGGDGCAWACAPNFVQVDGLCVPWLDDKIVSPVYGVALSLRLPMSPPEFARPGVRDRFVAALASSFGTRAERVSIESVGAHEGPARRLLQLPMAEVNARVSAAGSVEAIALHEGYNQSLLVMNLAVQNFNDVILAETPRIFSRESDEVEAVPARVIAAVVTAALFIGLLSVFYVCATPDSQEYCVQRRPPILWMPQAQMQYPVWGGMPPPQMQNPVYMPPPPPPMPPMAWRPVASAAPKKLRMPLFAR